MAFPLAPATILLLYAFNAGGYFPGPTAWGVAALASVLLVRTMWRRPRPQRLGGPLGAAVGAMVALSAWTLLSAIWSHALWRALVEFDRVVLYALALALFGSLAMTPSRAALVARAIAFATVAVCTAALFARLLPGLYPLPADFDGYGLAYPVTYANTLGLLAALGLLLCAHLTSGGEESPGTVIPGAAAVPMLAATLVLTGSRGALLAGALGLAIYITAARPRALTSAALATVPTAALAAFSAGAAEVLHSPDATSAAAVAQGSEVAAVICLSAANAALVRWLLNRNKPRPRRTPHWRTAGSLPVGGIVTTIVVAVWALPVIAVAATGPSRRPPVASAERPAASVARAAELGLAARIDHWQVALDGFGRAPLEGNGAGTYETLSQRERPRDQVTRDAHSLPIESLAELGLVGFALLATAVVALLRGLVAGAGSAERQLFAVTLALAVAWLAHATIDWDWEMPVVTLPVMALCGAVLATRPGALPASSRSHAARGSAPAGAPASAIRSTIAVALVVAAVAVAVSEDRLGGALAAARDGDCYRVAAVSRAFPLSWRPEAHVAAARCELRRAQEASGAERRRHARYAARALEAAARLDPHNRVYRDGVADARRVARSLEPAAVGRRPSWGDVEEQATR